MSKQEKGKIKMPQSTWTNERIETLKTMWAEGHHTLKIAEAIGVSRGAVIGKAHRLCLATHPTISVGGRRPPECEESFLPLDAEAGIEDPEALLDIEALAEVEAMLEARSEAPPEVVVKHKTIRSRNSKNV